MEELFRPVTKAKCNNCGWSGSVDEVVTKYVGIPFTEDVEGQDYCPVCGNSDLTYE